MVDKIKKVMASSEKGDEIITNQNGNLERSTSIEV
jgi:hypothetical protein